MLFRSNDTATTEIYTHSDTLSLHDALPISTAQVPAIVERPEDEEHRHAGDDRGDDGGQDGRSPSHLRRIPLVELIVGVVVHDGASYPPGPPPSSWVDANL